MYRLNETPTTLYTDTVICKITAAEVIIVQEAQEEETFLDSLLEPYLEPEPVSSYTFEIGTDDGISIVLGQIIDPQGNSDVVIIVDLGHAEDFLEFSSDETPYMIK